jgi:hypothetical protein
MLSFQRVCIRGRRFRSFRLSRSWHHHGSCSVLLRESALHGLTIWLQRGLLWPPVWQECEDQRSAPVLQCAHRCVEKDGEALPPFREVQYRRSRNDERRMACHLCLLAIHRSDARPTCIARRLGALALSRVCPPDSASLDWRSMPKRITLRAAAVDPRQRE